MSSRPARRAHLVPLAALLALVVALAGCGRGNKDASTASTASGPSAATPSVGSATAGAPASTTDEASEGAGADLGFPAAATKNTTRVDGTDPVALAAQVALATFPATSAETRPPAVVLVDRKDWQGAIAASALMAPPVRAPILYTDDGKIPAATQATLDRLGPPGSQAAGRAQVIRVGSGVPRPTGLRSSSITGRDPAALARAVAAFVAAARQGTQGETDGSAIVVSQAQAAFAAPAAAYSARTGVPVLFAAQDAVPADTRAAIRTLGDDARIFELGPSKVLGPGVTSALKPLGAVRRVGDQDPTTSSVAFARYRSGSFGFGITQPGHGFVVASSEADPATAPAVSALSSAGTYGPLLLTQPGDSVPSAISELLLDVKPGFLKDPTNDGVYNRGWVIGDQAQLTVAQQARLDSLLEAVPVQQPDQ